jgi:hypothetical protein
MKSVDDVFFFFEGEWAFDRRVMGTETAFAQGKATFEKIDEKSLSYREEGRLQTEKSFVDFYRNYIYILRENVLDVIHGEGPQQGQLYQSYQMAHDCASLIPISNHFCDPDTYEAQYQLTDKNTFDLVTKVTGPKKGYTISTRFTRRIKS